MCARDGGKHTKENVGGRHAETCTRDVCMVCLVCLQFARNIDTVSNCSLPGKRKINQGAGIDSGSRHSNGKEMLSRKDKSRH